MRRKQKFGSLYDLQVYQTEMEWKITDHHKIMINFITHIIKLFVFHVAKTIFYRLMEIISDNLEWIEMQKKQ